MKLFLLLLLVWSQVVFADVLPARLVDEAHLFNEQQTQRLLAQLEQVKNKSDIEFVVVSLQSLQGQALGQTIEEYANQFFRKYELGAKSRDNGLLFVFSLSDRKMRLEVGRGLEGSLTDLQAKGLLDQVVAPYFKDKKYEEAILDLSQRVMSGRFEIQESLGPKKDSMFYARFFPLGMSLFFSLFVYLFAFRSGQMDYSDFQRIFGEKLPPEVIRYKAREPTYMKIQKILAYVFWLVVVGMSIASFIVKDEIALTILIVGSFVWGFLIIVPMSFLGFRPQWVKWYKNETDAKVKEQIKKLLSSQGYKYSAKRDSFSMPSSSSSSNSSSGSSPSGGGSSSGGGASSSW